MDIQLEDDAEYRCQVTPTDDDPTPLLSNKVTLTVRIPPFNPVIIGGPVVAVELGKATNITCLVNGGKPGPTVTWYIDNSRIANNVFTKTTIRPNKTEDVVSSVTMVAKEEDAGKTLECWAINDALKEHLKTTATLDVQFKPKVTIKHNITRPIKEKDNIRITCKKIANPSTVTWRWYRNNAMIQGENKDYLDIRSIGPEYDKNKIKCEATNSIGVASEEVQLTVLYGAYFTGVRRYIPVDIGDRNVKLECIAEGNPKPSLIWRKKGKDNYQPLSTNSIYTIPYVMPSSIGAYVCTATSVNTGFPDVSVEVHLLLKGPPEIISETQQYAAPEDTVSVECVARSVPEGTIEWYRSNEKITYAESGRYTHTYTPMADGLKDTLHIKDFHDSDFGEYNCTVINSRGNDSLVIVLLEKEVLPLAYIIGGVCGGVAVLLFIAGACILYHRMKHSDSDSYAETDSNTEIRKRDKTESPLDFGKSTLMDQWRQDLNYQCPSDYDEVYNKDPRLPSSNYGTLKSDNFINAYENHNGHLFSDYTHRGDETFPTENTNGYTNGTYGTSSFRSASRTDFVKPVEYTDPYGYRLPPADNSTTQLATNV
ncbi:hypothetical protein FSP39_009740 [Pinctada imbricata]|uniref:Ig-like domain-containing protein n=1 Tax=Pinctada imbricata TaxID=66713 RepID=A0AA88Y4H7_PINIB|nr:hypothetical protein FSP39_009740 [Pinctada imbricata]